MIIETAPFRAEDGHLMVCICVREDEADDQPTRISMPPAVARQVAFGLMDQADQIDPPEYFQKKPRRTQ